MEESGLSRDGPRLQRSSHSSGRPQVVGSFEGKAGSSGCHARVALARQPSTGKSEQDASGRLGASPALALGFFHSVSFYLARHSLCTLLPVRRTGQAVLHPCAFMFTFPSSLNPLTFVSWPGKVFSKVISSLITVMCFLIPQPFLHISSPLTVFGLPTSQ